MVTGNQIRAARAMLDWTQDKLAERAGISKMTVVRYEGGVHARGNVLTLDKIEATFIANGIKFDANGGVRRES